MIASFKSKPLMVLLLVVFSLLMVAPTFAQTDTPVPSNTPVPPTLAPHLEIDPSVIFSSANTWIGVFDDVVAIGIGISIALAILTFLGYQIVKALRGGGGR